MQIDDMARLLVPMLPDLRRRYAEPHRWYHNIDHIHACLAELHANLGLCRWPGTVMAAIWFHDCVYDSTRSDNEEQSAALAVEMLAESGVAAAVIEDVRRLILATKHQQSALTGDEAVMVDIDLSILGRPEAEFDAYECAIRQEYAHVSGAEFAAGRTKVLQHFLSQPRIFQTARFYERFEQLARANIARSLDRLRSGPPAR